MAGEDAPPAVVPAVELRCPQCGAPWTLRGFNTTRTLACAHCGSVIDTSGERWQLVQKVEGAYRSRPCFALGTRGTLQDTRWEVIGWCQRSVTVEGTRYAWDEHLLFNPYEGFRYLVHQDGHFNFITPLAGLPTESPSRASFEGRFYRHFTSGKARVDEVLGEFPWQMKRGDTADTADYVAPPFMLSRERQDGEVVWSRGEYLERAVVLAAFGKPARELPWPKGVYPCQPNPDDQLSGWLRTVTALALVAWLLASCLYMGSRSNHTVWTGAVPPEGATADIDLQTGRAIEVDGRAPVDNGWAYVNCMLVGPVPAEQARYVGVEVSYYHGVEGGESWSEGSQSATETVAGVPPGHYVLQVTPDPSAPYKGAISVTVREDVGLMRYPCCAVLLLFLVPIAVGLRSKGFETRRWAESDHAP